MTHENDQINALVEPRQAATLRSLLQPVVEGLGLDLVLVEYLREHGRWVLRLYIDRPSPCLDAKVTDGPEPSGALPAPDSGAPTTSRSAGAAQAGVTVTDCRAVSLEASALLDVHDPIANRYTLEVSSPGLDRPLVRLADFERFAGRLAQIRTGDPHVGRRSFRGRLQGVDDGDVLVADPDSESTWRIPYANVRRARLEYEL